MYSSKGPKLPTVKKWVAKYKRGRKSLEDDPRSGRPNDVTNDENAVKVESMVMADRRLTINDIATGVGLSHGTVCTILHKRLKMNKVCCRWVPRNLSDGDQMKRLECSRELLTLYDTDPQDFCSRVVTGDETWLHHWDPDSKSESMQWKHTESPTPRKFRTQRGAGKVMATIFWDADGVLLIDYKPNGSSINGAYYAQLLMKLKEAIKQKRRGKLTSGVLLLHDNAPVHKAKVAQDAIQQCGFEELRHPPYSPDLAPSDYYLFRHLKKHLRGTRYFDNEELQWATEDWLRGQSDCFYSQGIRSLRDKWSKCVVKQGDYIEK